MTGNSIKPKFVKKTNKQNLPKGFDISRLEIREKKVSRYYQKNNNNNKKSFTEILIKTERRFPGP